MDTSNVSFWDRIALRFVNLKTVMWAEAVVIMLLLYWVLFLLYYQRGNCAS